MAFVSRVRAAWRLLGEHGDFWEGLRHVADPQQMRETQDAIADEDARERSRSEIERTVERWGVWWPPRGGWW